MLFLRPVKNSDGSTGFVRSLLYMETAGEPRARTSILKKSIRLPVGQGWKPLPEDVDGGLFKAGDYASLILWPNMDAAARARARYLDLANEPMPASLTGANIGALDAYEARRRAEAADQQIAYQSDAGWESLRGDEHKGQIRVFEGRPMYRWPSVLDALAASLAWQSKADKAQLEELQQRAGGGNVKCGADPVWRYAEIAREARDCADRKAVLDGFEPEQPIRFVINLQKAAQLGLFGGETPIPEGRKANPQQGLFGSLGFVHSGPAHVKAHTRRIKGRVIQVQAHEREVERATGGLPTVVHPPQVMGHSAPEHQVEVKTEEEKLAAMFPKTKKGHLPKPNPEKVMPEYRFSTDEGTRHMVNQGTISHGILGEETGWLHSSIKPGEPWRQTPKIFKTAEEAHDYAHETHRVNPKPEEPAKQEGTGRLITEDGLKQKSEASKPGSDWQHIQTVKPGEYPEGMGNPEFPQYMFSTTKGEEGHYIHPEWYGDKSQWVHEHGSKLVRHLWNSNRFKTAEEAFKHAGVETPPEHRTVKPEPTPEPPKSEEPAKQEAAAEPTKPLEVSIKPAEIVEVKAPEPASSGITTDRKGRRTYLRGNTFNAKESIKAAGGHWDPDEKAWWVGDHVKAQEIARKYGNMKPSTVTGNFSRLPDGSWGVRGKGLVVGQKVTILKKDGSKKQGTVRRIVEDRDGWQSATFDEIAERGGPTRDYRGRGTRTGCRCGSVEEYEKPTDCAHCRHDRY